MHISRGVPGRRGGLGVKMIQALETITLLVGLTFIGIAVGSFTLRIIQLELRKRGFFNSVQPDLRLTEVDWRRA